MAQNEDDEPEGKAGRPRGPGVTRLEMDDRIEYAAWLLSRRLLKRDVKRALEQKYKISARTCEEYISRARKLVIEQTGKSKNDHSVASVAFYESVLSGPDASLDQRMRAQERLDRLLGLEAPRGFCMEGSIGVKQTVEHGISDDLSPYLDALATVVGRAQSEVVASKGTTEQLDSPQTDNQASGVSDG